VQQASLGVAGEQRKQRNLKVEDPTYVQRAARFLLSAFFPSENELINNHCLQHRIHEFHSSFTGLKVSSCGGEAILYSSPVVITEWYCIVVHSLSITTAYKLQS